MVFQDSYASLNPRLTIADASPSPRRCTAWADAPRPARARELLAAVGLEPGQFGRRYPHELSGGQRQRVNIARALALRPRLVILDEPVSALDKSVEAQVLNLLMDLKAEFGLTYLFISHDLSVVQHVSDRVLVMYLGQVAEIGPVDAIYGGAAHPYTAALLDSRPSMDPARRRTEPPLTGDPPNPVNPPSGCRFRTRCRFAEAVCSAPCRRWRGRAGPRGRLPDGAPGSGHRSRRTSGARGMSEPLVRGARPPRPLRHAGCDRARGERRVVRPGAAARRCASSARAAPARA